MTCTQPLQFRILYRYLENASVKFWKNIFFSGDMLRVFGKLCCFPVDLFWSNLHLDNFLEKNITGLLFQINIAWSVFTGLINWRGLHLSHIWTIHLYWVEILRFVLGLLCFFRFQFLFLLVKSYVGWKVCALASHLHDFCFQSEGGVKNLKTRGGITIWGYFCWGVSTPAKIEVHFIIYVKVKWTSNNHSFTTRFVLFRKKIRSSLNVWRLAYLKC